MSSKPTFENMNSPAGWRPDRPYIELSRLPPGQALHHRARRRGRIGNLVDKKVGQRQAASRYLKELAGAAEGNAAGKERPFIDPRLMQLLQQDSIEFARYD
jgi:hypothetical protein